MTVPYAASIALVGWYLIVSSPIHSSTPEAISAPTLAGKSWTGKCLTASRASAPPTALAIADDGGVQLGGGGTPTGIGQGFGGYIGGLRRDGLDLVLVIDGTGAMHPVVVDLANQLGQLVAALDRLVPNTRVGVVEFGGVGETIKMQRLTTSAERLRHFLFDAGVEGAGRQKNIERAISGAIEGMNFRPAARKVIVLLGDSAPGDSQLAPLVSLVSEFRRQRGEFSAISVTKHERASAGPDLGPSHGMQSPNSPSAAQPDELTQAAYAVLASAGGGSKSKLRAGSQVGKLVLVLAFGRQWESQVSAFWDIPPSPPSKKRGPQLRPSPKAEPSVGVENNFERIRD